MASNIESLFNTIRLEVVVPDGSLDLPNSLEKTNWLETLATCTPRDLAFFDERLEFVLTVRIPHPSALGDPIPPPHFVTFLSHLQISLEASYISPILSPSTPIPSPTPNRLRPTLQPAPSNRSQLTPRPAPIHPPVTPNPIPYTSVPDLQYARTEGGAVIHSYIWGEGREKEAVDVVGRAFALLWSAADKTWVAVYKLDISVVWMQTRFPDPLLCLTASATLRDKPLIATPQREPLLSLVSQFAPSPAPAVDQTATTQPSQDDDDWALHGFEEVNLLSGLSQGTTFGNDPNDPISVPSSRLSEAVRHDAFSLKAVRSRNKTGSEAAPTNATLSRAPIPTLRKSYRKILAAVSGIKVRMRTTFVPYMSLVSTADEDGEEERLLDAANEERTIVLSVELENAAESGMGFLVESVKVTVGGESARADLIGWGGEDGPVVSGEVAEKRAFPLRLSSADQYNLLYAVSFLHPITEDPQRPSSYPPGPSNAAPPSQRSLSIAVTGRPYIPGEERSSTSLEPTKSFSSRWNSMLDLSAATTLVNPQDRPSSPMTDRDALPVPASPFPLASPSPSMESSFPNNPLNAFGKPPPLVTSPVAGSKRHTIAGLTGNSKAGLEKLGRKLLNTNYRASTGTMLRSNPSSFVPASAPPPLPPLVLAPNAMGKFVPTPTSLSVASSSQASGPRSSPGPRSEYFSTPSVPISTLGTPSPEPKRDRAAQSAFPPTPIAGQFASMGQFAEGIMSESETLMLSVSLLPPRKQYDGGDADSPLSTPTTHQDKIYPLDTFALEIFVFNKSSIVRRCEISYPERPEKSGKRRPHLLAKRDSRGVPIGQEPLEGLPIVPLENHVRVGPLRPDTCQSVRMQFLALQPGMHTIDLLNIRDYDSDYTVNLRSVMHVVVHEYAKPS